MERTATVVHSEPRAGSIHATNSFRFCLFSERTAARMACAMCFLTWRRRVWASSSRFSALAVSSLALPVSGGDDFTEYPKLRVVFPFNSTVSTRAGPGRSQDSLIHGDRSTKEFHRLT